MKHEIGDKVWFISDNYILGGEVVGTSLFKNYLKINVDNNETYYVRLNRLCKEQYIAEHNLKMHYSDNKHEI